jgi:hypothetical protein
MSYGRHLVSYGRHLWKLTSSTIKGSRLQFLAIQLLNHTKYDLNSTVNIVKISKKIMCCLYHTYMLYSTVKVYIWISNPKEFGLKLKFYLRFVSDTPDSSFAK